MTLLRDLAGGRTEPYDRIGRRGRTQTLAKKDRELTYTDVYIGQLGEGPDPLDWGGDPNVGNVPARVGPFFPPHWRAFHMLIEKIESGELPGRKVDWGAWAANVSKQQIEHFFNAVYVTDPNNPRGTLFSGFEPRVNEMRDFIRALPDGRYALIASEL